MSHYSYISVWAEETNVVITDESDMMERLVHVIELLCYEIQIFLYQITLRIPKSFSR